MQRRRTWVLALLIAVIGTLGARGAHAQEAVEIDFLGGVAVPAGDLSDFYDLSPAFTVGVNYPVHERVSLRLDGGADILSGSEIENSPAGGVVEAPNLTITRFTGGGVFHLLRPEGRRFFVDGNLGGGIAIVSSQRKSFSVGAGTAIVDISEKVNAFLSGQAFLTFADAQDTEELGRINPDEDAPETFWSFPLSAGLKFAFQP